MKKELLIAAAIALFVPVPAQVVLNQVNTHFMPGPVMAIEAGTEDFAMPATAPDQFWDYSALIKLNDNNWEYTIPDSKYFPAATYCDSGLAAEFISDWWYDYDAYYQTGPDGVNYQGFVVKSQRYGISITGNIRDSCNFPEQSCVFENPSFLLPFPATMGTSWQTNRRSILKFELSVAAFGLNKVPCQKVTNTVRTDTIISWGKLRVPTALGPSLAYDVLLLQRKVVEKDSFYLAGNPAPQSVLGAFGISQGQTTLSNRFIFWRENANYPLLMVNFGSNNFTEPLGVFYDGYAQHDPSSYVAETNLHKEINIYPNPANERLYLTSDNHPVGYTIFSSAGQRMSWGTTATGSIDIKNLPRGMYYTLLKTAVRTQTITFIRN